MSNQEPDGRTTYRRRKRSQMHAEAEAEVFTHADIADHPMVVTGRPELVVDDADLVDLAEAVATLHRAQQEV